MSEISYKMNEKTYKYHISNGIITYDFIKAYETGEETLGEARIID